MQPKLNPQIDAHPRRLGSLARACRQLAEAPGFQNLIVGTIILSTLLVGMETLPWAGGHLGELLATLEQLVLAIFVVELVIRITAHGSRPWNFFRNGWNLFDFVIIALCFLPNAQFTAVLRVLRLLRILRVLRVANKAQQAEIYRLKHEELAQSHNSLLEEQAKSERLLMNILPIIVAQRLKKGEKLIADSYPEASVLFADIVGFTSFSSQVSAEILVGYLDDIFSRFDQLAEELGIEKIKTIGDCYMVVAGLPEALSDHAQRIADMAIAMQQAIDDFNREHDMELQIRVGINSGPVVAGVIGQKKFIYDLWGDTVNTASRMESHGVPGRIQITEQTRERLPQGYLTEERGIVKVKGKGEIRTWFLVRQEDRELELTRLLKLLRENLPAGRVTTFRNLSIWAFGHPHSAQTLAARLRTAVEAHYADAPFANRVVTRDGRVHMHEQLIQLGLEGVPLDGDRVDMAQAEVVSWEPPNEGN